MKNTATKIVRGKPELARLVALFISAVIVYLMVCTMFLGLFNLVIGRMMEKIEVKEKFNENINLENLEILQHDKSICRDSQVRILFCIKSHIGNFKKRQVLRDTWLTKVGGSMSYKFIFVLGTSQIKPIPKPKFLTYEENTFSDIVQGNFIDSYRNLTIKSAFLLKWAHDYCPQAEYVMSVDDDTFVNLEKLEEFLSKASSEVELLAGYAIKNRKPFRNQLSKYNDESAPSSVYPTYTIGSGYVMSSDVVSKFQNCTINQPLFHSADVFDTGVCGHNVSQLPFYNPVFNLTSWMPQACFMRNVITIPDMTAEELSEVWDQFSRPNYMNWVFCFLTWNEMVMVILFGLFMCNVGCMLCFFTKWPKKNPKNPRNSKNPRVTKD